MIRAHNRRRAQFLAGLLLLFVAAFILLVPSQRDLDPLRSSFLQATTLPVRPGQVRVFQQVDGIVFQRTLPALMSEADADPAPQETASIRQWHRRVFSDQKSLDVFFVATDEERFLAACTVDWAAKRIRREISLKPVSEGFFTYLRRVSEFHQALDEIPFSKVNTERVQIAMAHPDSLKRAEEIIARSEVRQFSEIGGFITMEETEGGPRLRYYLVPGVDERFAEALQAAQFDFNAAYALLRDNPERFKDFLEFEHQAAVRALEQLKDDPVKRQERLAMFLDLYLFRSRTSYLPSQAHLFNVIGEGVTGLYVATFHVHPLDNTPSMEDRMMALTQRMLVMVPRETGFDLFDLYPGVEDMENPDIAAFRSPQWIHGKTGAE